MDIPKSVWGNYVSGKYADHKLIVEVAENGGWDILLFPPEPSTDIWNYWATDEEELQVWFSEGDPSERVAEVSAWVRPSELAGVIWDDVGLQDSDVRCRDATAEASSRSPGGESWIGRWWRQWKSFNRDK